MDEQEKNRSAGEGDASAQAEAGQAGPQEEASADAGQGGGSGAELEQDIAQAQSSVDQMQEAVEQVAAGGGKAAGGAGPQPPQMPNFDGEGGSASRGIELLGDVDLDVSIELGRSEMLVEDVLKLGGGSVVELDKLAGDPVDVHVNGRLVARGEVLVLNDNFCIRVSEIVADLDEEAGLAAQQQSGQAGEVETKAEAEPEPET
jgi:flagellar motor switch protein FliN/FliY